MSSEKRTGDKKPGRFGALGELTKAAPQVQLDPPTPTPENTLEPFSSHLLKVTKRRLKQAAAREDRKLYEALEQAVAEYLDKYHRDIQ